MTEAKNIVYSFTMCLAASLGIKVTLNEVFSVVVLIFERRRKVGRLPSISSYFFFLFKNIMETSVWFKYELNPVFI